MCWLSNGNPCEVWIWSGCYGLAFKQEPLRGMDMVGVLWVGYQTGTPAGNQYGWVIMGLVLNGSLCVVSNCMAFGGMVQA